MRKSLRKHKTKILFFLCVLLFLTPQIYSGDIQSILRQSVGGDKAVERIKTLQSIHISGSVNMNGLDGKFEYICKFPNKFLLNLKFRDFTVVQGYDGAIVWHKNLTGQKTELTGSGKRDLLSTLYLNSFSYLFDDSLNNKRQIGKSVINGKTYYQIMFNLFPEDTIMAYFNTITGNRTILKTRQDLTDVTTYEKSYQTVENIKIPFIVQTTEEKFNFTTILTIKKIVFDKPFDDSLFLFQKSSETNYRFSSQDEIKIKFEFQNNRIFLPVTLSGKKKVYMILDSGAGASVIHLPIAEALNLDTVGTIPAVGVSGFINTQLVKTDSLQISDLTIYNQIVGSLNLETMVNHKINKVPFGGILGNDFISQFPLLINYKTKELTIYDPKNYHTPVGGKHITFEYYNLIPTIECEVAAVKGKFLVDLGNSIGLVLHPHFVSSNNLSDKIRDKIWKDHLIGGVGGSASGFEGIIDSVVIGEQILNNVKVYLPQSSNNQTSSKEIDGNIGNVLLREQSVFFDYKLNKIVLYSDSVDN